MGGLLAIVGLVGLIASVIALFKPIPKIGLSSRKRAALGLVVSLVVMGVAGNLLPATEGTATATTSTTPAAGEEAKGPETLPLGQAMNVGDAALTVEKVETRKRVGIEYGYENASEGGVLVVVHTAIKNTGSKPLAAYRVPQIKLIDPAGTEYKFDVAKSASYSMERGDLNAKVWSDLNPGITVRDAKVFEVSAEQFNPDTWTVGIGNERRHVAMK
jgi:hypothetical protein